MKECAALRHERIPVFWCGGMPKLHSSVESGMRPSEVKQEPDPSTWPWEKNKRRMSRICRQLYLSQFNMPQLPCDAANIKKLIRPEPIILPRAGVSNFPWKINVRIDNGLWQTLVGALIRNADKGQGRLNIRIIISLDFWGVRTEWVILTLAQIRVRSQKETTRAFVLVLPWMSNGLFGAPSKSTLTHLASCGDDNIMPMGVYMRTFLFFCTPAGCKNARWRTGVDWLVALHFHELATSFWMVEATHCIFFIDSHLCAVHVYCLIERKLVVKKRCRTVMGICDFIHHAILSDNSLVLHYFRAFESMKGGPKSDDWWLQILLLHATCKLIVASLIWDPIPEIYCFTSVNF